MLGIPGLDGGLEVRLILRTFGGIARHGEEAPAELAAPQVVRGDIAAGVREIATRAADDDDIAGEKRRAGQRVGSMLLASDHRVDLPHHLAGACVEGVEPAVERGHE